MNKIINFKTRGWKFTENNGAFYGVNCIKAEEVCSYENHSIELKYCIGLAYYPSEKTARYLLNPIIDYDGNSYQILYSLIYREFNNVDLSEVLLLIEKRIKDSYIIEFNDKKYSEFYWANKHRFVIEKPSNSYPTDLLYYMEEDADRKYESVCIKMGEFKEVKNGEFYVTVVLDSSNPEYPVKTQSMCCKQINL